MALHNYSQLHLDADGILLESSQSGDFLLDDDGILRDGYVTYNSAKWSDSGVASHKLSLPRYDAGISFDNDYRLYDTHSLNISELEASRDDLTIDAFSEHDFDLDAYEDASLSTSNSFSRKTLPIGGTSTKTSDCLSTSFDSEYYQKLKDAGVIFDETVDELRYLDYTRNHGYFEQLSGVGVLVDEYDEEILTNHQNSLDTFENLEALLSATSVEFEDIVEENENVEQNANNNNTFNEELTDNKIEVTSSTNSQNLATDSCNDFFDDVATSELQGVAQSNQSALFIDEDAESIQFDDNNRENDGDELFYVATNLRSLTPTPATKSLYSKLSDIPSRQDGLDKQLVSETSQFDAETLVISDESDEIRDSENKLIVEESIREYGVDNSARSNAITEEQDDILDIDLPQSKNLSKAQSQESFFVSDAESTPKVHKRILPKPHTADNAQSFKMKSKSTTNIAKGTSLVKPTHMSLAEITRFTMDDNEHASETQSITSDKSRGELSVKLKNEFMKRKHATELVQQLQTDYDKLLAKYALAELTIDQMRLGAKITLHSDSPTPNTCGYGSITPSQQGQMITLGSGQRSTVISPLQNKTSHYSPINVPVDPGRMNLSLTGAVPITTPVSGEAATSPGTVVNSSTDRALVVKYGLAQQADQIYERLLSFETLLDGSHLSPEERNEMFEKLRTDHDKLRHDYLQAKEDYAVLLRVATDADTPFDRDKELEGCLFQLGMKFDELHEKVDVLTRMSSSQRQPFQMQAQSTLPAKHIDHTKLRVNNVSAGDDLLKPKAAVDMDDKMKCLHDQYNLLMDRYRQIKQQPSRSRDTEHETQNLIKKLTEIAAEAPNLFNFPSDLENKSVAEEASSVSANATPSNDSPQSVVKATPNTTVNSSAMPDHKLRKLNLERLPSKKKFSTPGQDPSVKVDPAVKQRRTADVYDASIPRPGRYDHSRRKNTNSLSLASLPDSGISENSQSATSPVRVPRQLDGDGDSGFIGSDITRAGGTVAVPPTTSMIMTPQKQQAVRSKDVKPVGGNKPMRTTSHQVAADRKLSIKDMPNEKGNWRTYDSDSESWVSDDEVGKKLYDRNASAPHVRRLPNVSAQGNISSSDECDGVGADVTAERNYYGEVRLGERTIDNNNKEEYGSGDKTHGERSSRLEKKDAVEASLGSRNMKRSINEQAYDVFGGQNDQGSQQESKKETLFDVPVGASEFSDGEYEGERPVKGQRDQVNTVKYPHKEESCNAVSAVGNVPNTVENSQDSVKLHYAENISDLGVRLNRSNTMRPKSEILSQHSRKPEVTSAHSQQLRTLQEEIQRLRVEVKRSNDLKQSDSNTIYSDSLSEVTTQIAAHNPDLSKTLSELPTPGRHMIQPPPARRMASLKADSTTDSYVSDMDQFKGLRRPQSAMETRQFNILPNAPKNPIPTQKQPLIERFVNRSQNSRLTSQQTGRNIETETTDTDTTVTFNDTPSYTPRTFTNKPCGTQMYGNIPKHVRSDKMPQSLTQPTAKNRMRNNKNILSDVEQPTASRHSYIAPSSYVYRPLPHTTDDTPQILYPAGTLFYPLQERSSPSLYAPNEPLMHSSPNSRNRRKMKNESLSSGIEDRGDPGAAPCNYCWGSGYIIPVDNNVTTHPISSARNRSQSATRSRSASRDRRYVAERARPRYRVWETHTSDSGDSDDVTPPARRRSVSLIHQRSRRTTEISADSDADSGDLNVSIHAAAERARQIDKLTRKMIHTVRDEISKCSTRRHRDV